MKIKIFLALFFSLNIFFSINLYAQKSGEIVFSNKLIDPNKPANLTTEFKAGDKIYSVAFLPNKISSLSRNKESKNVDTEIFLYEIKAPLYDYQQPSEEQFEFGNLNVSGEVLSNNYLMVDIVPSAESITAYGDKNLTYKKFGKEFSGPVKYAQSLGKLSAGEHTIIVKVKINYEFVAEGRFKITGDDFTSYTDFASNLNESAEALKYKDAVMPGSAMNDKKLEAEMISALKNSQTYKDRIKGDIIKLVIIDPDWMIRRNEITGIILNRYIRATAAVKNNDGTCTVWQLITFQQDYIGNKFGKTKFDGVGDPYKIPCENVSK